MNKYESHSKHPIYKAKRVFIISPCLSMHNIYFFFDIFQIYGHNKYIIPNSFNSVNDNILSHIKTTDDPVLQHILLYFVEYYKQENLKFSKCPDIHIHTGACQYLNKWLHFTKGLYTYSGKYKKNKDL